MKRFDAVAFLSNLGKTQFKQVCLECGSKFSGNTNKKFCSADCKSIYHNKKRKAEAEEIGAIINILKSNRRILAEIAGDKSVKNMSEQQLLDRGYIFRYHTHRRINKGDSKEYIFCFDYGYLPLSNGWYTIVKAFKD